VKCKKSLMGLAALLIVIFHFYMPLTSNIVELTIYKAAYIGVDLFFFVSAYSLGQRDKIKYGSFILNRFTSIYLSFVVMAVICFFYNKWELKRFFQVIFGIEFFKKGGGSFLWFAIAIMLIYLLAPFMVSLKKKYGWKAFAAFMLVWLILVIVLQFVFKYTTIFILLNRLPIFFIGMYYGEIRKIATKKRALPIILITVGLVLGGYLVYRYCGKVKLMKPITDIYYVISVPFTLALVGLFDLVSARAKFRNLPLQFIGGFTFELYGLQMIFGFKLTQKIVKYMAKYFDNSMLMYRKLVSFILATLALIAMAYVFSLAKKGISKLIKKLKEKYKK